MIAEGTMDGVSMDGGEIYKAGEQLQPLAAETYNVTDGKLSLLPVHRFVN